MAALLARVEGCSDPSLNLVQHDRMKTASNRWCYLSQVCLAARRATDDLARIGDPQVTAALTDLTDMVTGGAQVPTQGPIYGIEKAIATLARLGRKVAELVRATLASRLEDLGTPKAPVFREWTKLVVMIMAMLDSDDIAAKDLVADLHGVPRGSKPLQKWLGIVANARADVMTSTQTSLPDSANKWISIAYRTVALQVISNTTDLLARKETTRAMAPWLAVLLDSLRQTGAHEPIVSLEVQKVGYLQFMGKYGMGPLLPKTMTQKILKQLRNSILIQICEFEGSRSRDNIMGNICSLFGQGSEIEHDTQELLQSQFLNAYEAIARENNFIPIRPPRPGTRKRLRSRKRSPSLGRAPAAGQDRVVLML